MAGTQLCAGSATTFTTATLPVGTTYFRLCAIDNMGNGSAGVTVSVKITGK